MKGKAWWDRISYSSLGSLLLLIGVASPMAAMDREEGPEGRILFTRQIDRQDDLLVLHLPSGEIEKLTDHRAKDSHGVPSPDGRWIVFNSERVGWWKIWRMRADGTGIEQLTRPRSDADYHPVWSSDGSRILYATGSEGNGDIISMAADGKNTENLTRHPAQDNHPAASPDGRWIAFASDRGGSWGVHVMGSDGSGVRRITREGQAVEPAWFPDSRRLAVEWHRGAEGDGADLWIVGLDGETAPIQLTRGRHDDERPTVSPDGEWIVFESDRAGGSQLFLVPSQGGEPRQLTRQGYCYGASWFPKS
ncbi:MAG: hypothetical protein MI919_21940 [Holophagales bacterium]|nr:hypothetical protein [Holophagales bacterium]